MQTNSPSFWFVGASWDTDDQTPRFIKDGIWENGYQDKYIEIVKKMQPGERIAIKSAYTKKHDLPFDNRSFTVSVMAIKAVGTIIENLGDGRRVRVDWNEVNSTKLWYFFTNRTTVWRLQRSDWSAQALIDFAFDAVPQDIDKFRNAPFWAERFGDANPANQRFGWTPFYEAMATALLPYQHDRSALVAGIQAIANRIDGLSYLAGDKYANGMTGFLRDICPFTTLGLFNRGITLHNRQTIARELALFLGVTVEVPESFEGLPVLNNMKSWYFGFENERPSDQIDSLWRVFSTAIGLADSQSMQARDDFAQAFDDANGRPGVAWNLTFGLYWSRPWSFLSLDSGSQTYINQTLRVSIPLNGPKKRCNADDYLSAMDALEVKFQDATFPVHSYPELSLRAWKYAGDSDLEPVLPEQDTPSPVSALPEVCRSYTLDDIVSEGCFVAKDELESLLVTLRNKQNLILQGPPGTGKTWLAKRLAYALIGQFDQRQIKAVQFHPSLSYEDFVRGWRPSGDGKLTLVDGAFMQAVQAASQSPKPYIVVIEEINRGNPAQIFGDMLTLLESDKRRPDESLELSYKHTPDERIYLPSNLYVIGTMNVADRSLALVDMALRRRFAFVDLKPCFTQPWRDWLVNQCGMDTLFVSEIEQRMTRLNADITADLSLGVQFCVGHSFCTPTRELVQSDAKQWFLQVVATEIAPLLGEYWFDAPSKSHAATERLTAGL